MINEMKCAKDELNVYNLRMSSFVPLISSSQAQINQYIELIRR